jgi:MSHA biogenesis protein MshL
MKSIIVLILILSIIHIGAGPADTQPVPEKDAQAQVFAGFSKRVSLDLRGMDIIDTLKFLAMQGNLNIVASKNVSGRITLFLKDVTIADVLEIILVSNDLALELKEDIIMVVTEKEYEALHGVKFTSKKQTKTITLRYADPNRVGTILGNLRSSIGKVIIDDVTATIVVIDTPEKIKEMEDIVREIDLPTIKRTMPTVTEIFELEYARVGEIQTSVKDVLTKDVGEIRTDERTNKMIVTDLPHNIENIREMIKAFDERTRQVFIEAKIIEISLSDDFAMGVDWKRVMSSARNLMLEGVFPFTGAAFSAASTTISVGTMATQDYELVLEFIKSYGRLRTVSSPQLVVCNNEEAKFMVGAREAYITSSITTGEVTTTVAESVQFIDVGVTIYVTPTINKEGYVKLNIRPEISTVERWVDTSQGNRIPIVATSNIETEVLIPAGRTIILAGLIKETDEQKIAGVPFLSDVPFVRNMFRSKSDLQSKKELVIFLTPYVVSDKTDIAYSEEAEKVRKPPK